jgi:hypothetical protein
MGHNTFHFVLRKESLNSDGQQLHKHQQSECLIEIVGFAICVYILSKKWKTIKRKGKK